MLDHALDQDERRAQIDIDRVIELLQRDIRDLRDALAVAGVGDEDVRELLSVRGSDVGEHPRDLIGDGDVDLVRRDAELWGGV